jgi:hypothetical protein
VVKEKQEAEKILSLAKQKPTAKDWKIYHQLHHSVSEKNILVF